MTVVYSCCPYCEQFTSEWLYIRTVRETGDYVSVCRDCAGKYGHEFVGHFTGPDFDSWVNWEDDNAG